MYSSEVLTKLVDGKIDVVSKIHDLLSEYVQLSPRLVKQAQEHCQYGICRRLMILTECLEYFFSEIPPDSHNERQYPGNARANIYLHAFLINVCGIIDNMAWLWAYQTGLQDQVDLEKKRRMIGLFNTDFRKYLPEKLAELTKQYAEWHEFMSNHRHPTAHRIPPYVIPYTNPDEKDPPSSRDYTPRYTHSFSSKYGPVYLHQQSIVDANTIVSLLETLLKGIKTHDP